jgi:hypothetical protein
VSVRYRYELRRGDEIVATGHLSPERPLEVGDQVLIGGRTGIVRVAEPLLGENDFRLVVQLRYGDISSPVPTRTFSPPLAFPRSDCLQPIGRVGEPSGITPETRSV